MLSANSRRLIEIVHGPQTAEQWEEIERDHRGLEALVEELEKLRVIRWKIPGIRKPCFGVVDEHGYLINLKLYASKQEASDAKAEEFAKRQQRMNSVA